MFCLFILAVLGTSGFFIFYSTFLSLTFGPNILNIAFLLGDELDYFSCLELLLPLFVEEEEFESCLDMLPD